MESISLPLKVQLESLWRMFPTLKPRDENQLQGFLEYLAHQESIEIEDFRLTLPADKIIISFPNEEQQSSKEQIQIEIADQLPTPRTRKSKAAVKVDPSKAEPEISHYQEFEAVTLGPGRQA